jgi:hypothetical protein
LADFYKKYNSASKKDFEIVWLSSDHDQDSFETYFATMPWVAMSGSDETAVALKNAMVIKLKTYRLPTLVILNTQTGSFITDDGRKEVEAAMAGGGGGGDDKDQAAKIQELIASWKERPPTAIGGGSKGGIMDSAMKFLFYLKDKNPLLAVALIAMIFFTPAWSILKDNPIIGIAILYFVHRIFKENTEPNLPYVVQQQKISGSKTATTTPSSEKKTS